MRSSRASHVLFVEGTRNDYGFSLDITLRGVSGGEAEKAQGWCNFCTGPQMVTAAENVARPLLVHLAARPDPGAGGAAPGVTLIPQQGPKSGRAIGRVLLGAGVAAIGAAAIVVGSVRWQRDGEDAECFNYDGTAGMKVYDCAGTYQGKNLGIGLVIGGAVVAGLGTYLMLFTKTETSVAVTPGGVSVAGKF